MVSINDGTFSYQQDGLTVCVTCVWADVDSAWEQKKLEPRKTLENAARREAAVPLVGCTLC